MGQYWKAVNLDKKEFIDPHKLGSGLKLWEQLHAYPGPGSALIILLAAMPEPRGGGDLEPDPIIGHWAGDRVAIIGDYAEDSDLPPEFEASKIWEKCEGKYIEVKNKVKKDCVYIDMNGDYVHYVETEPPEFKDITDQVCKVIEKEFNGKYKGTGWRDFVLKEEKRPVNHACKPDMVLMAKESK